MKHNEVIALNKKAWDAESKRENEWTVPVSSDEVAKAKRGDWAVVLTPQKKVPESWFGNLQGKKLLGLASGGGQQCPLFSAAGADVTLFDNSPRQLEADGFVAERDGLSIRLEEGDMTDLSRFGDETFDLIFHPVSNVFVPSVLPVWQECFRVLKKGGTLLAGFCNPVSYAVDPHKEKEGTFILKNQIPYSDLIYEQEEREELWGEMAPLEFGHTLQDQIGGQLQAGFVLVDMYEDKAKDYKDPASISYYLPVYIATKAVKPF